MTRLLAIALAVISLALVVQTTRAASLDAKRKDAVAAASAWRDHALGWMANFKASERLRGAEAGQARTAVGQVEAQCAARVATARQSARAIERIVTLPPQPLEPTHDQTLCPARRLVDAGQLRDALGPTD